jgi:hypothetical protein
MCGANNDGHHEIRVCILMMRPEFRMHSVLHQHIKDIELAISTPDTCN